MATDSSHVDYENLVLKGGGVKSYAYIGSLHSLEDSGVLGNIQNVAGSSAGALYASLIGLNYSASEIEKFVIHTDLSKEMKEADPQEVTHRFFTQYGNYTGDYFINDFNDFISQKFGNSNITFQQIHDQRESLGLKDVFLTGVDVSEGKSVVFSYENTPDMTLSDALRISCSYPLMYTPPKMADGHYYVDGGLLNNYPVDIFNSAEENKNNTANPKTLGLYLGSHSDNENALGASEISSLIHNLGDKFSDAKPEDIDAYLNNIDFSNIDGGMDQPINDIVSYMAHLFHVYSQVEYREYSNLHEVLIDGRGFNALDLNISDHDIHQLIDNGRKATDNYITHNYHLQNTDFVT